MALAAVLGLGTLLLSGCSFADWPRFGWPAAITPQGRAMQEFWSASAIAALAIGVVVWGLMFWAFIVYRKKKGGPVYPKQTKENLPLEIAYTVIPFVMVGVLFFFTVKTENYVLDRSANPDVEVSVTAFKWNWDFSYPGTTDPSTGQEVHTIGTSEEVPILVVPVNKNIEYTLQSKDVIHSFWTIDFLFKRDVFPDPGANQTENKFQNTIEYAGAFVGRCAELCGTYHSQMNFEVRAVPEDVYQAYIAARQTVNPATGLSYTTADALTKVGQEISSCGELCAPLATSTYPFTTNREAKSASEPMAQAGGN